MAGSTGILISAAIIAVLFYMASPGIIWNFPDKNIVKDAPSTITQKANRVNVMIVAVMFGVAMAVAFPLIQKSLDKM
jgi:hypothetical protein